MGHRMDQIDTFADSIFDSVKAYVSGEVETRLAAMRAEFEAKLAAVQTIAGKDGRDGIDGKDGAPGKDGGAGIDGKDGRDGIDGKDGAEGIAGQEGEPGADGVDGADGKDGATGADGTKGIDGAEGLPGIAGQDGRDGRDGKDGAPGKDALQIEILEAIEEQRSYRRGTYAKHDGGLIRAYRQTEPIGTEGIEKAGWQPILAGIKEVEIEAIDERGVKVVIRLSDGKLYAREVRLPAMIYQGIWVEREYEQGDTVTRDGSLWHCERTTTATPGGTSPDWKLAAKRGRDGKEGRPGERGVPGPDGKPGKDFSRLG